MKEEKYHVLYAIKGLEESSAKQIGDIMEDYGTNIVSFACRYKKIGVEAYLNKHPDVDVLILSHYLEESNPYKGSDYEFLVDNHEDLLLIPILGEDLKGSEIVKELYRLGIYTALYENDADYRRISEIISQGRGRKEAKIYYGIDSVAKEKNIQNNYQSTVQFLEACDACDLEEGVLHVLSLVHPEEFRIVLENLSKERYEMIQAIDNNEIKFFFPGHKKKREFRVPKPLLGNNIKNSLKTYGSKKHISNNIPQKVKKVFKKKNLYFGGAVVILVLVILFNGMFVANVLSRKDTTQIVVVTIPPSNTEGTQTTVSPHPSPIPTMDTTKKPSKKTKKSLKKEEKKVKKEKKIKSTPNIMYTKKPVEKKQTGKKQLVKKKTKKKKKTEIIVPNTEESISAY